MHANAAAYFATVNQCNSGMMKTAVQITFLQLAVVGATGLLMRAMPYFSGEFAVFNHVRHAHSHLAFLGWVFSAFFLGFLALFLGTEHFEKNRYKRLFWLLQASIAGMFVAFWASGYGFGAILFLSLHTLLAYLFFVNFLKDWRPEKRLPSSWFAVTAVAFFLLSSLGPLAIPVVGMLGDENPRWVNMAVHFYLHFQYSGWFMFGLLAMLLRFFEKRGRVLSTVPARTCRAVLTLAIFPAYFIALSGSSITESFVFPVMIFAFLQWVAAGILVVLIIRQKGVGPGWFPRMLWFTALTAILLKYSLEFVASVPLTARYFQLENRFLTLGYLHLVFLGAVTSFILWLFWQMRWGKWATTFAKTGLAFYLGGFVISEGYLFMAGLRWFPPYFTEVLLVASGLLLAGILLMGKAVLWFPRQVPFEKAWQTESLTRFTFEKWN
jgi:hypothetical protein